MMRYFLIILFVTDIVFAQQDWFWQNPKPQGNYYTHIHALNENEIFIIGELGTLYKTTNAGRNWYSVLDPNYSIDKLINIFFINQETGWCVGENGLILKTINKGEIWKKQNGNTTERLTGISFINSNTGYITGNGFIMKTTNSGNLWIHQNSTFTPAEVSSPTFINANSGWVISRYYPPHGYGGSSIHKSTDGGFSWSQSFYESYIYDYQMINANTGYISCGSGYYSPHFRFYKTTNSGLNWSIIPLDSTWRFSQIKFTDDRNGIAIGGTRSGIQHIFITTDGGYNWDTNTVIPIPIYSKMSVYNNSVFWGFGFASIYRGNITDNSWDTVSGGLVNHSFINSIFFIDEYNGWASGEEGMMRSFDGGNNWQIIDTSYPNPLKNIYFKDINSGYASKYYSDSLYFTTNGGLSWNSKKTLDSLECDAFSFNSFRHILISGQKHYPAPSNNYFLKSTNNGNSWDVKIVDTSYSTLNQHYFINDITGYYLTRRDLYKTVDGGNSWRHIFHKDSWNQGFRKFSVINEENIWLYHDSGNVIITTNGGISWKQHFLEGYSFSNVSGFKVVGNKSAILMFGPEYFITTNNGDTWQKKYIPSGLVYTSYFLDSKIGWLVGQNSTIIKTTNCGGLFVNNMLIEDIPNKYEISQNYPNPFNPSTTIKFQVPEPGDVSIKIYDITGREVANLLSQFLNPGEYSVVFNPKNLASGVYFYTLTAANYKASRKMVLIK